MQAIGLAHYHAWAFATTRQLGAAMELLAAHLRWLAESGVAPGLELPAGDFLRLSEGAKTFILKAARAVNSKKPLDARLQFADMAGAWDAGMAALVPCFPAVAGGAAELAAPSHARA